MRNLPKDEYLKPIRPITIVQETDLIWIQVDQTQSRQTDRGMEKSGRMKMKIPRSQVEFYKKKYINKNLKILK